MRLGTAHGGSAQGAAFWLAGNVTFPRVTVRALASLNPARHTWAIARAEAYLVDRQGRDGGFPTFVAGSKPEIAMTAGALNALDPNREQHAALIERLNQ